MRKHKQLLNSAGQSMHTNTPYCILNMNFDTHLKRERQCVCVCVCVCAYLLLSVVEELTGDQV